MKMINDVERIKKLKKEDYQKIFGIKNNTFERGIHLRGGHPSKLSVLDGFIIMISY